MPEEKKIYLGDGAYASNDGFQVSVECERENGLNIVYLDPGMVFELVRYTITIGLLDKPMFIRRIEREI